MNRPARQHVLTVVGAVAAEHGVHPDDVFSDYRVRHVKAARWEAWRRLHRIEGYALHGIAEVWGCHHTSIMYAMRQLEAA